MVGLLRLLGGWLLRHLIGALVSAVAVVGIGVLVVSLLPEGNLNHVVKAADRFRAALLERRWDDACAMTSPAYKHSIGVEHGNSCRRLARRLTGPGTPLRASLACHSLSDIEYSKSRHQAVGSTAILYYGVCRPGDPEDGTLGVRHVGDSWLISNIDAWTRVRMPLRP